MLRAPASLNGFALFSGTTLASVEFGTSHTRPTSVGQVVSRPGAPPAAFILDPASFLGPSPPSAEPNWDMLKEAELRGPHTGVDTVQSEDYIEPAGLLPLHSPEGKRGCSLDRAIGVQPQDPSITRHNPVTHWGLRGGHVFLASFLHPSWAYCAPG